MIRMDVCYHRSALNDYSATLTMKPTTGVNTNLSIRKFWCSQRDVTKLR